MNGFFGNLFDFNHDGKLDSFERTADFVAFTSLMEDEEKMDIGAGILPGPLLADGLRRREGRGHAQRGGGNLPGI